MLYTINLAFTGGRQAEVHADQLRAEAKGDADGAGGKRWRESKPSGPKIKRRPV